VKMSVTAWLKREAWRGVILSRGSSRILLFTRAAQRSPFFFPPSRGLTIHTLDTGHGLTKSRKRRGDEKEGALSLLCSALPWSICIIRAGAVHGWCSGAGQVQTAAVFHFLSFAESYPHRTWKTAKRFLLYDSTIIYSTIFLCKLSTEVICDQRTAES
jgi:hypothetical protein